MRLKKTKNNKSETVSFRISIEKLNKIKMKAQLYTNGNLSEWITFAATTRKPAKDDFE